MKQQMNMKEVFCNTVSTRRHINTNSPPVIPNCNRVSGGLFSLFIQTVINKVQVLYYNYKALPVLERRCDVQMDIILFVVMIIICPIITGIIANYLYDKFK